MLLVPLLIHRVVWAEEQQNHTLLVTTAWLQQHLDDAGVVIVDARDAEEYLQGHLPGAINIPVEATFSQIGDINRIGSISQILE